ACTSPSIPRSARKCTACRRTDMRTRIDVRRHRRLLREAESEWSPGDARDELDVWALHAFGASGFGDGGIDPADAFEVRQAARLRRALTLRESLLRFFGTLREWLQSKRPRVSGLAPSRLPRVPDSEAALRDVGLADEDLVRHPLDAFAFRHRRS